MGRKGGFGGIGFVPSILKIIYGDIEIEVGLIRFEF